MQQEQTTAIGIDIGATTTRVGVVTPNGKLAAIRSTPTPKGPNADEALIARLADDITALRRETPNQHVSAIGLAVPGLVDTATNTVRRAVNVTFLEGDWLVRKLVTRSGLLVTLHTDIDAAAWSECDRLAPTPTHFAHLRLGSGIGLGVIVDGHLIPIEPDRTTHARVLIVDERDDAPACPCGLRGCLELFAGGRALVAAAKSIGVDDGLPALEQATAAGDVPALELLDATSGVIVRAIQNIARHCAAEVVVLGGGVLEHLPTLWTRIAASTGQSTTSEAIRLPHIERAQLGDDAGVIGAALLSLRKT